MARPLGEPNIKEDDVPQGIDIPAKFIRTAGGEDVETELAGKQGKLALVGQAEAEAGADTAIMGWSALRVRQAIDARIKELFPDIEPTGLLALYDADENRLFDAGGNALYVKE